MMHPSAVTAFIQQLHFKIIETAILSLGRLSSRYADLSASFYLPLNVL